MPATACNPRNGLRLTMLSFTLFLTGCASGPQHRAVEPHLDTAIDDYTVRNATDVRYARQRARAAAESDRLACHIPSAARATAGRGEFTAPILTLGVISDDVPGSQPASQAVTSQSADAFPPEGYWREDIWHQMGNEALSLGERDFWRGFKKSFWDVENALLLTAAMGASITIRGTDVDDTVRDRTYKHRQLGEWDETIQIIGNPGTHFAAAGALWLGSALAKDVKQHEVAKSLTQALAVNGLTTVALKVAANTRTPDEERYGWPSGHTSSAFTVAAVVNEYYGPWVGVPSLALAGLVGYQRIDSRVHDLSDVVFGAMLGYVVGSSIARDGKAHFPEIFGMKVIPYADPETGVTGIALMKQY